MSEDKREEQYPEGTREFDPKEVEEILIKQAEARATDPTEMAAEAYQMYVPHYKRLLPKMSSKQLRRVLNYLILYPLEQADTKGATDMEKQYMQMCNSLIEAKFVMIMSTYNEHAEKLVAAQEAPLTLQQEEEIRQLLNDESQSE